MSELTAQTAMQDFDLTNCDREPIHILGNVQHFGCLIAVSSDWIIAHASGNCGDILGYPVDDLLGLRFVDFFPNETIHDLRSRVQILAHQDGAARIFDYDVFGNGQRFDISVHRSERFLVFEFEPRRGHSVSNYDGSVVQNLIARVQRHDRLEAMCKEASRGLKALTGFDRVMVYRFEPDDTGTVIAEALTPGLEPYLGLRYPASDIPKQARELYLRSPLRIIADVDGPISPILPGTGPTGDHLDLSMATTRAVSPIHLEYLRNMGVAASMSVSIVRKGRLWGLFACHHTKPLQIDYERRSAVELFGQLFTYELAQLETEQEIAETDRARQMHDRLMAQVSGGDSLFNVFELVAQQIEAVIPFDGLAIYSDGRYQARGSAPTEEEFLGLARFLNTTPAGQIYAEENLSSRYEHADVFADRAVGLMAIPISRQPRDYLVLFRREAAQSVNWAGNPEKPVELGPNGIRLTPRKSFAAWQEVVRGTCTTWRAGQLRAAEVLRVTLLEVVLKLADQANQARKRAQEQQELLIAELNHRVRNILNLIRSLVSQGRGDATTIDAYSSILDARIHALARAHDQLTERSWGWVPLKTLIRNEVTAFLSESSQRVHVTGADIGLSPTAFTTMALVVHELVTNSAKYGALSDSSGRVEMRITTHDDGVAALSWREQNGPPVQAPAHRGFGTTIIEQSVPFELRGTAEIRYRITGVEADFTIPRTHVSVIDAGAEETAPAAAHGAAEARLHGQVLVLEDNMIIAMDAGDMLTDLGAEFIHTASNVADALRILQSHDITFALLDVNLGDELSLPVAQDCAARNIPTILGTGYGNSSEVTDIYPESPIIRKPYVVDDVQRLLGDVLR